MESGGGLITENGEKILVSVRLRPLNEEEISNNDVTDWECITDDTLIYKNANLLPSVNSNAYTFDRVFSSDSFTRTVYEQGVKDAAISAIRGVNSTILAYGETNSGKTYTMTGITEYAVADIYDYIEKHPEREFVMKFSAMEIYNECVRDLLSTDNTSLKLVDDPKKGTVVENLTEEILGDRDHVTELLFICQAQRQSGDALLDELSPQSHQIIRLTIESSPRGRDSSCTLVAAVNFVDLAGSERASRPLSTVTRFKQEAYMDNSLLTLGAVISKLSKGGKGHIPYDDSNLTRILETSLGGNARTAILCTMSPARSHVGQSKNTLEFASCAKDVTTHARVNVIMSDKALVKHLREEVARLENEMKSGPSKFAPRNFSALLKEKDSQIEKLEKEIKELILQRDIFQSQVNELLKMVGDTTSSITQVGVGNYPHLRVQRSPDVYIHDQASCKMEDHPYSDVDTCDALSRSNSGYRPVRVPFFDYGQSNVASPDVVSSAPNYTESELFYGWHEIDKSDFEDLCREDNCPEKEHCRQRGISPGFSYFQKNARIPPARKVHANGNDDGFMPSSLEEDDEVKKEIPSRILPYKESRETNSETVIKVEEPTSRFRIKERDQSTIGTPDSASLQKSPFTRDQVKISLLNRSFNLLRSISCNSSLLSDSSSPWFKMIEYSPDKECENCRRKLCSSSDEKSSMKEYKSQPVKTLEMETATPQGKASTGEDHNSTTPNTNEEADQTTKEKTTTASEKENEEEKKEGKDINLEQAEDKLTGLTSWPVEFKRLQREIIELWHACNVALVHRTYFFMLFKGDPSDAIYLEVEIRRMKLLKEKLSKGEKIVIDGQRLTLSSSAKALKQERKMLSEQMSKKMSEDEREKLFVDWEICLNSKMRRLQLANMLWSKTGDVNHINESAFLVAKLVGFLDPGQAPSKEVFGMNLTPKYTTGICTYKRSLGSLL